jgi:acid phosphatase type 7
VGTKTQCRMRYVSDLLLNPDGSAKYPTTLALGDTQYICGGLSAFQQSYGPTWGRVFDTTRPVIGDKDYRSTANAPKGTGCSVPPGRAEGFFSYFGSKPYIQHGATVGSGIYYSFNVPDGCTPDGIDPCWHVIAINGNCVKAPGCTPGTPEYDWIANDLATYPNSTYPCTLAYWHFPRFSSGKHGSDPTYDALWRLLYQNGVEVVLNAHEHTYERFAPQSPTGVADPTNGIREFVVGTGGYGLVRFPSSRRIANSQASSDQTFGILTLTLHLDGYDWRFIPQAGQTFTDASTTSTSCH